MQGGNHQREGGNESACPGGSKRGCGSASGLLEVVLKLGGCATDGAPFGLGSTVGL